MYETTELSSIPTSGEETVFEGDVKNLELFSKFDFSVEKIKKLQQNDAEYCSIIKYLESNILPKSQKKARRVLLESSDYVLIDGLLLHSRITKSKRAKTLSNYQLVVPEIMIKQIVQLYHDSPMSGNAGIQDTLDIALARASAHIGH